MQKSLFLDWRGPRCDAGLHAPSDARGLGLQRYCKGADNSEAIAEQKAARKQSADQFAIQMGLQMKQFKAAQNVKTPVILPTAPPQTVDQNTLDQRREVARQQARRFSFATTMNPSGAGNSLGGATNLGGPRNTP